MFCSVAKGWASSGKTGSDLSSHCVVASMDEDTSDSVEINTEPRQQPQANKTWSCVKCFSPRENQNPKYCSQCKSLAVKICVRKSCQFPYFEHEVQKHFSNAQTLICVKCEKKMEKEKQRQAKMREMAIQNNHRHFNAKAEMPDKVKQALHQKTLEESFSSLLPTKNASSVAELKKKTVPASADTDSDDAEVSTHRLDEEVSPPLQTGEGGGDEEEEEEEPSTALTRPLTTTTTTTAATSATNLAQQIGASTVQKVQPVRKRPVRKGDEGEGSGLVKKRKSSKKVAEKEVDESTSLIEYQSKSSPSSSVAREEYSWADFTQNLLKDYWKFKKPASGASISSVPGADKTQLTINFSTSF